MESMILQIVILASLKNALEIVPIETSQKGSLVYSIRLALRVQDYG